MGEFMTEEFRKRIAKFLSNYIDVLDCKRGYGDNDVIRQGIKALIKNDVFSVRELQKQAIKEADVLMPAEFIEMCVRS